MGSAVKRRFAGTYGKNETSFVRVADSRPPLLSSVTLARIMLGAANDTIWRHSPGLRYASQLHGCRQSADKCWINRKDRVAVPDSQSTVLEGWW